MYDVWTKTGENEGGLHRNGGKWGESVEKSEISRSFLPLTYVYVVWGWHHVWNCRTPGECSKLIIWLFIILFTPFHSPQSPLTRMPDTVNADSAPVSWSVGDGAGAGPIYEWDVVQLNWVSWNGGRWENEWSWVSQRLLRRTESTLILLMGGG